MYTSTVSIATRHCIKDFLAMKFPIAQVLEAVFSLYMYPIVQVSLYSTIAIPEIYQFYV